MAFAAIAFAKAKRRRQFMVCTSSIGPGALNMVTAAGVAHANLLPVMLLAGDSFASRLPDPVLQQVEHFHNPTTTVNDAFKAVTRYWDRITRPEQILQSLPQAIATMLDPADCGPVFLGLCQDTQAEAFDYHTAFFEPRLHHVRRQRPDLREIGEAAELLKQANNPLIVAGGGVIYSQAASELRAFAASRNILVVETMAGRGVLVHEEEKERIHDQLVTFKTLGAPVLVYAETTGSVQSQIGAGLSTRPRLEEAEFRDYGRKLTALAEWISSLGVPMAYHHHMGTIVENQHEIDVLMANTGAAVGLLLDTGHLTYAGGDVSHTTHRHARRINHVHCKDIRPEVMKKARQGDQSFLSAILDGVFTVPGDGVIDYYAFARVFAEIGYEGWVVVEAEQDPAKAPPGAYSALGHRHLTEAFRAAGFEIVE